MNDILNNIKRVAVNAVNAQKLTDVVFGNVVQTNPLKVQIDQKLVLDKNHLQLTRAVRDYEVEMSVNGGTKQKYMIYNGLKSGERVVMIREHGGQQYIIIDKE